MLYLTTLQFDGVMLSYLKSELRLSDIFISIMRGSTVIAGLLGTVVMPYGERLVGLERTGAWSIWCVRYHFVPCLFTDRCYCLRNAGSKRSSWSPSSSASTSSLSTPPSPLLSPLPCSAASLCLDSDSTRLIWYRFNAFSSNCNIIPNATGSRRCRSPCRASAI
jgi:hypothetical protein